MKSCRLEIIYVNIGSTMLNKTMRYVYRIEQTLDISTVFEIVNSRVCKVRQIFERLRQVLYLLLYITQGL